MLCLRGRVPLRSPRRSGGVRRHVPSSSLGVRAVPRGRRVWRRRTSLRPSRGPRRRPLSCAAGRRQRRSLLRATARGHVSVRLHRRRHRFLRAPVELLRAGRLQRRPGVSRQPTVHGVGSRRRCGCVSGNLRRPLTRLGTCSGPSPGRCRPVVRRGPGPSVALRSAERVSRKRGRCRGPGAGNARLSSNGHRCRLADRNSCPRTDVQVRPLDVLERPTTGPVIAASDCGSERRLRPSAFARARCAACSSFVRLSPGRLSATRRASWRTRVIAQPFPRRSAKRSQGLASDRSARGAPGTNSSGGPVAGGRTSRRDRSLREGAAVRPGSPADPFAPSTAPRGPG